MADKRWKRPKGFRVNFTQPKVGSQSWKSELQLNRERADRAEEWLSKITTEIEDRLVNQPQERRLQMSRDHKLWAPKPLSNLRRSIPPHFG